MGLLDRFRSEPRQRRAHAQRSGPEPALVISRHADSLMRMRGVISVGVGKGDDGRPAIIVGVMGDDAAAQALPGELDGVPVVVKRTGRIDAL